MINRIHDPTALHERYLAVEPFPHIVLEDFITPRFAEQMVAELDSVEIGPWHRDNHPDRVNKRWMEVPDRLPQMTGTALRYMNSPAACAFFSVLTGVDDLQPDPAYLGGGVHVSLVGGRPGVHSDFNLHPESGLHRRVNALLFLNKSWEPAWQGQLELSARDLERPRVSVAPTFNRLVAFTVTDDALHRVPIPLACPPQHKTFSLALTYYTTADRPLPEKAPFHGAPRQHVASS